MVYPDGRFIQEYDKNFMVQTNEKAYITIVVPEIVGDDKPDEQKGDIYKCLNKIIKYCHSKIGYYDMIDSDAVASYSDVCDYVEWLLKGLDYDND